MEVSTQNSPQQSTPVVVSSHSRPIRRRKRFGARLKLWFKTSFVFLMLFILFRWLFLEVFYVSGNSMKGSLKKGDFILVSKISYGARTPNVPLQIPGMHQYIWGTDTPSYYDFRVPTYRLWGTASVRRGDIVVFNAPYDSLHPIEKKDVLVKRCVALPGDTLEIKNSSIYTNSKKQPNPSEKQYLYFVSAVKELNTQFFTVHGMPHVQASKGNKEWIYRVWTTPQKIIHVNQLKRVGLIKGVTRQNRPSANPNTYPQHLDFTWNEDNFGPLIVPGAGLTLPMSKRNVILYGNLIRKFENSRITMHHYKLKINGLPLKKYTFQHNYYFMLGDNFHTSSDSRFWGFVPEDHLIGKSITTLLSLP